jgi:uncharacterized membrane protein YfcA
MYAAKAAAFRTFGVLPDTVVVQACIIGASLMAGSFFSKRLMLRLPTAYFYWLMESVLLVSGLTMLAAAFL